jgi:hypothetical protein
MTLGFLSLGSVGSGAVMDDRWTGLDYPNTAQVVPVLTDGTAQPAGVLQSSAPGPRTGTLRCSLETADMLAVRGYYESREAVTLTEWDGTTASVRVLDFTRSPIFAGVWDVTAVLVEAG